jgi:hypothetical protein
MTTARRRARCDHCRRRPSPAALPSARAGHKVLTLRGATPRETTAHQPLCADIAGFSQPACIAGWPSAGTRPFRAWCPTSPRTPRCESSRGERPQAAGATVPLHHSTGAVGRTCSAQRLRAGGVEAQVAVARRPCRLRPAAGRALRQAKTVHRTVCVRAQHYALGHEPKGVHATAGGAGATAEAAPHQVGCPQNFASRSERPPALRAWRAGAEREIESEVEPVLARPQRISRAQLPKRVLAATQLEYKSVFAEASLSTSTCGTARTAAPGTSRSSRPSWTGR